MDTTLSYQPDQYYRYDEIVEFLRRAEKTFSNLIRVSSIGKSFQGRDLWLAEITNTQTGPADEKPAYWIDANIHAVEVCGSAVALYTIHYLLTQYGTDSLVTHLLDTRAFYVLPRLSPDGSEHVLTTGKWVRSSVRLYPFPEKKDGLQPADVNSDGEILQMRVPDPLGEWKVSTKDSRLLLKRQPDEFGGTYYRLYQEGYFENFDGFRLEVPPNPHGLDLNRNFPYEWKPQDAQSGSGEFPLSESETRAVTEFFFKHRNICGALTYHTTSGVILRPYSNQPDTAFPNLDLNIYKALGARGTDATGYQCVSVYDGFRYDPRKSILGVFDDWVYDHYGVFTFTTELWSIAKQAGIEVKDFIAFFMDRSEDDELKILKWQDDRLNSQGFVNWKRFQHPQLGEVEIGGWRRLYTWVNPPPEFLAEECQKNMLFSLRHAAASPLLRIRSFAAEPLGNNVRRLTLILANEGWLPTNVSQRALEKKIVRPIQVRLELQKNMIVTVGKAKLEIEHLAGTASTVCQDWVTSAAFGGSSKDTEKKIEWVVQGQGQIGVIVTGDRVGVVRATCQV